MLFVSFEQTPSRLTLGLLLKLVNCLTCTESYILYIIFFQCADPVILKNSASVNLRLAEVKHLVRIRPLTFPYGLPEHESDFEHSYIKTNGEFIVKKRLKGFEMKDQYVKPDEEKDPKKKWRLTQETLDKHLDEMKRKFLIHSEYHEAEHIYKRNQDGKEYRYNFHKPNFKQ